MRDFKCVVRKGENLRLIIFRKDLAGKENPGNKVAAILMKKHTAQEFWGLLPGWKKPTSELKHEMKKGWE